MFIVNLHSCPWTYSVNMIWVQFFLSVIVEKLVVIIVCAELFYKSHMKIVPLRMQSMVILIMWLEEKLVSRCLCL